MDIVFFTICGGESQEVVDRQYNFLLGSMAHHAQMGRHVVLDNSPESFHKTFTKLPSSVTWIYEPIYGHGNKYLRQMDALNRAHNVAKTMTPEAIVYTDCDEFWTLGLVDLLKREVKNSLLTIPTIHVDINGEHYFFPHEYHRRAWDGSMDVTFPYNKADPKEFDNPTFEGNPQRHAIACPALGMTMKQVDDYVHHHMKCFINGGGSWHLGTKIGKPEWPEELKLWKEKGILPIAKYL